VDMLLRTLTACKHVNASVGHLYPGKELNLELVLLSAPNFFLLQALYFIISVW
jgi:hypothetical protein